MRQSRSCSSSAPHRWSPPPAYLPRDGLMQASSPAPDAAKIKKNRKRMHRAASPRPPSSPPLGWVRDEGSQRKTNAHHSRCSAWGAPGSLRLPTHLCLSAAPCTTKKGVPFTSHTHACIPSHKSWGHFLRPRLPALIDTPQIPALLPPLLIPAGISSSLSPSFLLLLSSHARGSEGLCCHPQAWADRLPAVTPPAWPAVQRWRRSLAID